MTWLIIIALAIWVLRQNQRLGQLETKVRMLSSAPPVIVGREPAPASPPIQGAPAPSSPTPEPAKPATPTYKPAYIPQSAPTPATAPVAAKPAPPPPPPSRPPTPPRPAITWAAASTWLAENGLAWLGGVGLALGGLLLVVLAAQRGVFTPPFRIIAAVLLGLAMVAASEWIRRQNDAPGGRHALAAAAAAGAGAVTLYGAVWAAHVLYGLIPLPVAAGLAVAVSLGLLALSLLHGQALALLALFGAFLAPLMTGSSAWSPFALEAYLVLLGVTGAATNALRRWASSGLVTLVGLLVWTLVVMTAGRELDGAILLALGLAGPVAAVLWRRRTVGAAGPVPANDLFARLPMVALFAVAVGSLFLWTPPASPGDLPTLGVVMAGALVVAGAAMTVLRLVPANAFAAPVATTVLGLVGHLAFRRSPVETTGSLAVVFGLTAVIAASGLAAALRVEAKARTTPLAISAVAAAVIATFARSVFDHGSGSLGSVLAGLTALLLAAGAAVIARRVEDVRRDAGLGLWVAAAAELLFLTVHGLAPHHAEPVAMALAALALAAIANRLAWRGLAATTVAGSIVTLATMLRPAFVIDAASGKLPLLSLAIVTALAVGALGAAAWIVGARRRDHRTEAEALWTAALLTLLTGLFLILHAALSRDVALADSANALLEASLRTALVLSAGLLLATRGRPDDGAIARWGLIIVVTVGAAHGLLTGGLWLHPWWGSGSLAGGLPVLNDLLLTFLAPALLLAATARARPDRDDLWTRGWIAAAALFALLWVVTATRQAFHGATMHLDPIGRAEACAYAVIALLTARAFRIDRLRTSRAAWLHAAAPVIGWTALVAALVVFGWLASPWWGLSDAPMTSAWHVTLVLAFYAAGSGAALSLRRGTGAFDRAALCLSVGVLFALVTLAVRLAFHGADMRHGLDRGGLETWAFSAVWAVFGLVVLFRASARKDVALRWLGLVVLLVTAAKVLLFDMATLDGVVRAASFLAVGALFIAGALVVRRLNASPKRSGDDSPANRSSVP